MARTNKLPFQSFTFWIIEGRQPRSLMRLRAPQDEAGEFYTLEVTKGSATNPLSAISREVPISQAESLRDALQGLGVFGWEEAYGDGSAPGSRRWSLSIVFEEGVFSIESKGGSDVPARFPEMLEELYRLDFPRPAAPRAEAGAGVGEAIGSTMGALGMNSIGSMSSGDLGAYAATKGANNDFSYLKGMFGANGMPEGMDDLLAGDFEGIEGLEGLDASDLQRLLGEAQRNPQAFQAQMKESFKYMSPAEQDKMLDMLAATGMATREWWERFLRG